MHLGLLAPAQDDASCDSSTNDSKGQDIFLADQTALLAGAAITHTLISTAAGGTTRASSFGLGRAGSGRGATRSRTVGAIARRSTLTIVSAFAFGVELNGKPNKFS